MTRNVGRLRVPAILAGAIAAVVLLTGAATPAPTPSPSGTADPDADPIREAEYWLDDYGITEAWKTTRGKGVTIAVIDTGIAAGSEQLDTAVTDGIDVSGVGSADGRTPVGAQDSSHGTLVGSVAAARGTGPDTGFIGVAPEAQLLSVSVGFGASAAVPFVDQVPEAITWAVDQGADIINLSWTTNTLSWDESWDEAFLHAFENDVVIVVAAGNRAAGTRVVGAPATIPGVLVVGGVDENGKASVEASTQGITIGVAAPSEKLLGVAPDGRVVSWKGTSGAAPIVAGIAALIRSAHPELDADNVINRIIQTADPVAGTTPPDPEYGYGLVDAAEAVTANVPMVADNPLVDVELEEWIRLYRRGDAAPAPTPTIGDVEVPPLPPAEPPTEAGPPWLPSPDSLREGTLPLIAGSAAGILVTLGLVAVVRRIRKARSRPSGNTQSRSS
ncbi:S8 family serine peptidase [Microbacterium sediminis]|uniref:Peptidase S8 n=1 Tax=Microbacterium sediminis TaxID=904291 RepID=A0A1B9NJ32_9MICO|nr:S8 family serine peptidase [Microbacterium sediminis]OCG76585.1 peptidase S8 [Microbacterium sediminis]QBR73811.1 peptidase S8 [Microbacterium sediminis]